MHHIRNTLPDIKTRVTQQLQRFNAELASLGGPHGDQNAGNVVLSAITEFTAEFRTMIDGGTDDLAVNELSGGARIGFVFHELYNNGVKAIDPFDQVKDEKIRIMLYNSSVRFNMKAAWFISDLICRAPHRPSSWPPKHLRTLSSNKSRGSKIRV
jgi:vacuolar protein sorting-associated protein 1